MRTAPISGIFGLNRLPCMTALSMWLWGISFYVNQSHFRVKSIRVISSRLTSKMFLYILTDRANWGDREARRSRHHFYTKILSKRRQLWKCETYKRERNAHTQTRRSLDGWQIKRSRSVSVFRCYSAECVFAESNFEGVEKFREPRC